MAQPDYAYRKQLFARAGGGNSNCCSFAHASPRYEVDRVVGRFLGRTTFLKARSAPSRVSSALASRAASMKRLDCAGSSGLRLYFGGIFDLLYLRAQGCVPTTISTVLSSCTTSGFSSPTKTIPARLKASKIGPPCLGCFFMSFIHINAPGELNPKSCSPKSTRFGSKSSVLESS